MRGDINFKGSDSSELSVYFLFCDTHFSNTDTSGRERQIRKVFVSECTQNDSNSDTFLMQTPSINTSYLSNANTSMINTSLQYRYLSNKHTSPIQELLQYRYLSNAGTSPIHAPRQYRYLSNTHTSPIQELLQYRYLSPIQVPLQYTHLANTGTSRKYSHR